MYNKSDIPKVMVSSHLLSFWTLVDFTEISTVYMHIHTNFIPKLQTKEDSLVGKKNKVSDLYLSAKASITKYHRLGGLNKDISHSLENGSPRSKCQQGQVLARALCLAHRPPPSHCVLTWKREKAIFLFLFL